MNLTITVPLVRKELPKTLSKEKLDDIISDIPPDILPPNPCHHSIPMSLAQNKIYLICNYYDKEKDILIMEDCEECLDRKLSTYFCGGVNFVAYRVNDNQATQIENNGTITIWYLPTKIRSLWDNLNNGDISANLEALAQLYSPYT